MAKYQIPGNLIVQVQILLRKEAHLESFNPEDPSLPSPSTIQEALANIDLSVDRLRCKHCGGSLLRGLESFICVYCGHGQQKEPPHQPIPFKSTLGFGWLLQSLGLDASESVGPPIKVTQSHNGQSSLKGEISLSDLLGLELKWPDESKRDIMKNEAQFPGKRYLNLVGVDVDNLFSQESREHTSRIHIEQAVSSVKGENKETTIFPGQSLSLFENAESSKLDESCAWEAEFQFATPGPEYEQSSDVSKLSPIEGVSHIDSVPEPAEQEKSAEISIFHSKHFEDSSDDKNRVGDASIDEWRKFTTVGGLMSNQCQPSSMALPDTDGSSGLDISDEWNDFTGSMGLEQNQLQTNIFKVPNDDSLSMCQPEKSNVGDPMFGGNDFALLNGTHQDQQNIPAEVGDSFDFWNDFGSSSVERQQQADDIKVADNKLSGVGDGTIDAWNDIANLDAGKKEQEISNSMEVDNNRNGSHDGSFALWNDNLDGWNDFTGSTGVSDNRKMGNDHSSGASNDFSSSTITHADHLFKDDHLFNSWRGFRSSGTQVEENRFLSPNVTKSNQDEMSFGHLTPLFEMHSQDGVELSNNKFTGVDHDLVYGWGDSVKTSNNLPDIQLSSDGVTTLEGKSTFVNDDAIDAWTDFTSSDHLQANSWLSNPANAPDDKEAVKHDDPFDTWNLFVTSPNVQAHNETAVAKEHASERNLYSTNANLQGVPSNSCVHPDLFSGVFNDISRSSQVPADTAPEVRMENGDVKAEACSEPINKSETTSVKIPELKSSDVETLISEMHDLSFMLDGTLSISKSQ